MLQNSKIVLISFIILLVIFLFFIMLDLTTIKTEDLIDLLDKKFNYTLGWRSTVYTQKDLKNIAHNLLELLTKRDTYIFDNVIEVSKEIFDIHLEMVTNVYEGYVDLKTA